MPRRASVVTTVQMHVERLDTQAFLDWADLLREQGVPYDASIEVKMHYGQRDQFEGAAFVATVVHDG